MDYASVSACIDGAPIVFATNSTAKLDCLAASASGGMGQTGLSFERIKRCLLPCVRHWTDENVSKGRARFWRARVATDRLGRLAGPSSGLLLGHFRGAMDGFAACGMASDGFVTPWMYAAGDDAVAVRSARWVTAAIMWDMRAQERLVIQMLDRVYAMNATVSVLALADLTLPMSYSKALEHPALVTYFATNPNENRTHPKLVGFPTGIGVVAPWESSLHNDSFAELLRWFLVSESRWGPAGRHPRPYPPLTDARTHLRLFEQQRARSWRHRRHLLLINNDSKYGRQKYVRTLHANGFTVAPWMGVHELVVRVYDSVFWFCPSGNGAAESRFWEAATAGTAILTDYHASQVGLLTGVPTVMLDDDAFAHLTPRRLALLQQVLERGSYDAMRAFYPQWLYRLRTGARDLTRTRGGRSLSPPLHLGARDLRELSRNTP
jgi:hypothetical protein